MKLLPLPKLELVVSIFLEFMQGIVDNSDKRNMKGRYVVMDNAAIHKVSEA